MNYLIFSDESGRWNEGNYYIRSWIRVSPEDYELISKEIVYIKYKKDFPEVKWKAIINNIEKIRNNIESLFNIEFSLFVTISKPNHFKKRVANNRYIIIRTLKNLSPEQYTKKEDFTATIKEKIINKAQHTLFFNFFEKRHIKNSKIALVNNIDNTEYEYRVDSPQCYHKDWEKIAKGEMGIDSGLDYVGIAEVSTFLLLRDYGFVLKNHEKIHKEIDKKYHGFLFCGESKQIEDLEIIGTFDEKDTVDKKKELADTGKKRFERLKSGIVEVNRIYLTIKHQNYYRTLIEYSDNPFLPNRISQRLKKIVSNTHTNLAVHMKTVLIKFLRDYSNKYFKEKNYPRFSPTGIFNEFNHQRLHHKADVMILKNEVRSYLKIDDKW